MNEQYNAIDYAQQLEAAGVPKAQADLHAKALELVVSRCTDVHDMKTELAYSIAGLETTLRAEISKTATTLRGEMHDMEARLRAEMHDMEARLRAEMRDIDARLRAEIHDLESRLSRRCDSILEKLNGQKRMNALIVAMIVGLYVQAYWR